jgi:hypothetical protein
VTVPMLPRERLPLLEARLLAESVRRFLHALDRRAVDLSALDRCPHGRALIAQLQAAELAAESWRSNGARCELSARVLRHLSGEYPELSEHLSEASHLLAVVSRD